MESVAEQLLLWLPYLLDHLNFFISKFHSNNVALGKTTFLSSSPPSLSLHIYIYSLVSSLPFQTRHSLSCFIVYLFPPLSFSVGPRVFLNCPLETSSVDMELWFINLWNHFIIPYLMGTIMAGIEVCIIIE